MKTRIKQLMLKMQDGKVIASVAGVTLAFAFAFGLYAFRGAIFLSEDSREPEETLENTTSAIVERHPLTGLVVDERVQSLPQVFAVMIDDHVEAHPQSGIQKAFLAIEAPVEGNIPRIEAFYYEGQDEVNQIGPVRSARPYYLDWANELDAMYVHVGGSPEALELIAAGETFDFNQYWNGAYFWRSTQQAAPHNVYTSTELLEEGFASEAERGRAPENVLYGFWSFKDQEPDRSDSSVGVTVTYLAPTYVTHWEFDQSSNRYQRYFGGKKDQTLDRAEVWANNVVVVVTDVEVVDSVGRRKIRTIGEGTAYILQDGVKILGTWKKRSESERIRFFDENGEEIPMNPGVTWIQIVGSEKLVEFDE